MPGSLSKTKHRILAIQGTEKTTKAMGLIATVKTKRLKDAFEKSNFYIEDSHKEIIDELNEKKAFSDELMGKLASAIAEFKKTYEAKKGETK